MKLFEFSFKNGILRSNEYEVTETLKQYKKTEGRFGYRYNLTISKDLIDTVLCEKYSKAYYYYSVKDDIKIALQEFIDYLKNNIIVDCESKVNAANKSLDEAKQELEILQSLN